MIDLETLSDRDIDIVRQCLHATVDGKFFPDWEFGTLFGVDREIVRNVYQQWPKITVSEDNFKSAVIGALNNLLGYPHSKESDWNKYISVSPIEVKETLDNLIALGM